MSTHGMRESLRDEVFYLPHYKRGGQSPLMALRVTSSHLQSHEWALCYQNKLSKNLGRSSVLNTERFCPYKKPAELRKVLFCTSIRLPRYIIGGVAQQFRSREAISESSTKHWLEDRGQLKAPALTPTVNGGPHMAVISTARRFVRQEFVVLRDAATD